jgi:hypothetical protein
VRDDLQRNTQRARGARRALGLTLGSAGAAQHAAEAPFATLVAYHRTRLHERGLDMYKYRTKVGTFSIRELQGRWHVFFENEDLGNYHSPQSALGDLTGGHTHWPSNGIDPSTLGLPDELSAWTRAAL